jgi:hypothetical protein
MEYADGVLHVESFLAITIGIVALFVGRRINRNPSDRWATTVNSTGTAVCIIRCGHRVRDGLS